MQAAIMQFERVADQYASWRAVPQDERSPAPAWWWGPALEAFGVQQPAPSEWCSKLELPDGSSWSNCAAVLLKSLAEQTSLPWPDEFPRKAKYSGTG